MMNGDTSLLLQPWPGPFGGVPPWRDVQPADFLPAFQSAIASAQQEYDAIAADAAEPTFDNTVEAMERAGRELQRVQAMFGVHAGNLNVGPMPELQKQVMPLLAAHRDHVMQHETLFQRLQHIHDRLDALDLSEAQRRLVQDHYADFVRYGAKLSDEQKRQLTQINQRLASLYADFSQHVLDDEQAHATWIHSSSDLAGLPESLTSVMQKAATEQGGEHPWAVLNTRSFVDPFLTYAESRELRKEVWTKFYARGDNGDASDNNQIITEIIRLRAERAALLGYASHAHWALERSMAKTPEAAMDLMLRVWPKAVARVREEVQAMQAVADELGHALEIEPWDYRFYAEKVRKAKYDLDFGEVKPYLQLDQLVNAMLWCSSELFGLRYQVNDTIPKFHEDVRVWEIHDSAGQPVGVFYLDAYAREGKRSGAWMTDYREQYHLDEPVYPLVSNNSNFIQAVGDQPSLISWDDAETLFHEFGHALHGLLSKVTYPSQSGTSVARDYVEFPSQIYEHWLSTPEVLQRFCVHYETGEPIPQALVDKIHKASTFNQGYATVEFLSSAILDMQLHLDAPADFDPKTFEAQALAKLGMPREMVMRHRLPHFLHLFSSDGYSAAYYSYLWADALTADAAEAFEQQGSFFDAEIAQRLHDQVLSVGDTIDPAAGFRAFRGRDVDASALLRKRGFPVD